MIAIRILFFIFFYVWAVVLSTFKIAVLVLNPRRSIRPQFVEVPLDVKGEMGPFLVACLISMTPGTLSVAFNRERRTLLVHVIDTNDPAESIREMKTSFEKPLIQLFGRNEPMAS